ncbi:Potassium/sodium hyperpolarization-activated cyclic nucleotide-gated channel 4, partial [Globisporangium splendens]
MSTTHPRFTESSKMESTFDLDCGRFEAMFFYSHGDAHMDLKNFVTQFGFAIKEKRSSRRRTSSGVASRHDCVCAKAGIHRNDQVGAQPSSPRRMTSTDLDRLGAVGNPARTSNLQEDAAAFRSGRRDKRRSIYESKNVEAALSGKQVGNSNYLKKLSRGEGSREMTLLMNYRRTANVRAITYIELCVLSRDDFQRILTKHPEDRERAVSAILNARRVGNEINRVFCPLLLDAHAQAQLSEFGNDRVRAARSTLEFISTRRDGSMSFVSCSVCRLAFPATTVNTAAATERGCEVLALEDVRPIVYRRNRPRQVR